MLVFLFSVSINSFFSSPEWLQALILSHLHLDQHQREKGDDEDNEEVMGFLEAKE